MKRALGKVSCDLDQGQRSNNTFSCKCISWLEKKKGICDGVPLTAV